MRSFADCDGIAIELDLEKETVKQVLQFAKKYRKKGLCGGVQHEHCDGAPRLFAADRLLCL